MTELSQELSAMARRDREGNGKAAAGPANKKGRTQVQPFLQFMVERRGIEPLTSTMRTWRSPS